jgi:2,5-diamino-6-(ribosylamino)-4(3H)-pyrimidinone 5'-phosphate reductase
VIGRKKLPFVLINMAITADGKIATANRAVSSLGSKWDQEHLLELRATADAVMAGARTVDLNPVNMGPGPKKFRQRRLRAGLEEYNLRVIVSGSGSINPKAEIFHQRFSPIIIITAGSISERRLISLQKRGGIVQPFGRDAIDFPAALRWLRQEWNVKRLLCEGGGELNGALFADDLIDEIHLTICPKIVGGKAAPTIADGADPLRLAQARQFKLMSTKRRGDELFAVYRRV